MAEDPKFINSQYNLEDLIVPPPEYDIEHSTCTSDQECIDAANTECESEATA